MKIKGIIIKKINKTFFMYKTIIEKTFKTGNYN